MEWKECYKTSKTKKLMERQSKTIVFYVKWDQEKVTNATETSMLLKHYSMEAEELSINKPGDRNSQQIFLCILENIYEMSCMVEVMIITR